MLACALQMDFWPLDHKVAAVLGMTLSTNKKYVAFIEEAEAPETHKQVCLLPSPTMQSQSRQSGCANTSCQWHTVMQPAACRRQALQCSCERR